MLRSCISLPAGWSYVNPELGFHTPREAAPCLWLPVNRLVVCSVHTPTPARAAATTWGANLCP